MSAYDFACVWKDSEATGSALLVHLALADCAINGIARVRHEDLARLSRLHVASVGRAIEQLAASGQIIIAEPKAGTRPAQIVVWPKKVSTWAILSELPAYEFANEDVVAPETPLMQRLTTEMLLHGRFQPSLDDPGPPVFMTAPTIGPGDFTAQPLKFDLGQVQDAAAVEVFHQSVALKEWIAETDPGPTEIVDPLLDAIMGEPDEPLGYAWSAPAAIQPVEPPRTPPAMLIAPGDVARVLNAAGVPKNEELPGYWWRSEHKADLADLCARLGITVDVCIARITKGGRSMPDLRRIAELEPLVRG